MSQESLCADDWEIIKKYSDMVYRMAYSLLKNKYDAEDIHQEVFIQYMRKRPSFESIEHEKAWFLRVTINLCKNNWKTAWKRHLEMYIIDTKGNERHNDLSIGWQEEVNGERYLMDEFLFEVDEIDLANIQLYGIFHIRDGSIKGDWEVTFSIEN